MATVMLSIPFATQARPTLKLLAGKLTPMCGAASSAAAPCAHPGRNDQGQNDKSDCLHA